MTERRVFNTYNGVREEAIVNDVSRSIAVQEGPLEGQSFSLLTAAAMAVVQTINPLRSRPNRNGWDFWRLTLKGEPTSSLRR